VKLTTALREMLFLAKQKSPADAGDLHKRNR